MNVGDLVATSMSGAGMSLIKQIIKGENNCVKLIKVQQYTRGPIHSAIAATRFAKFNRSVHDKFEWGADKCVFKELKNGEFRFYTERYYYTPLEFCDKCAALPGLQFIIKMILVFKNIHKKPPVM